MAACRPVMGLSVTFWGVRGTIPCASPRTNIFGGNTSCVEITAGDETLILDCGTGLRALGKKLMASHVRRATILLSHVHLDHIAGFPFFQPAFSAAFKFRVLAGRFEGHPDIHAVLAGQMEAPKFPVPMKTMQAQLSFGDFEPGSVLSLEGGVQVRTAPLNHPDGACGYRIEHDGRSVAYVTDTEHLPGRLDAGIVELISGVDLFIYDTTYTDAEFASKIGWGHSTWREGIRLSQAAGAARLALFHHEPDRDDEAMAAIEREAQSVWPNAFAAREGMTVELG